MAAPCSKPFGQSSIGSLQRVALYRYAEIERCRQIIDDIIRQAHARYRISLRQLYHDREEVTGFIERIDGGFKGSKKP